MKTFCVIATMLIGMPVAAPGAVDESSATGNLRALAGKWKPVASSRRLLDSDLVSSNATGFEISLDRKLGDSQRKTSDTYYDQYSAFLRKTGHTPVGSGYIKYDYGGEAEIVIATKNGSLYFGYGVGTGGNPRIFLGRGSNDASVETLVVEWTSWCSDSPIDLERDFATVIYKRAE